MHYSYKTSGVCASTIEFDINDDIVTNIKFNGGCPGNLKMISKLLDGMNKSKIIDKCLGNTCGYKSTSCADQLAKALQQVK